MKQGALAIFVKTPGYSPVKTRLANDIGQPGAETFYLKASKAVTAVARQAEESSQLQCYYAVAEKEALDDSNWRQFPTLWQGEGGLGERMELVYRTLLEDYEFVLLIGADSPQITIKQLAEASDQMHQASSKIMVFGPSVDGGFWLFGGNCSIPLHCWTTVEYSQADTGDNFYHTMATLGTVKTLQTIQDTDVIEDLPGLHQALQNLSQPLLEQQQLMDYLQQLTEQAACPG